MPRYYCDYCDTYLTHDSPSVRKQHNQGYKHKANVRSYYQQFEEQQTQSLIDQKVKEHLHMGGGFMMPGGYRPPPVLRPLSLPVPGSNPALSNPSMLPPGRPLMPPMGASTGYMTQPPTFRPPVGPQGNGLPMPPAMPPTSAPGVRPATTTTSNGTLPGPPGSYQQQPPSIPPPYNYTSAPSVGPPGGYSQQQSNMNSTSSLQVSSGFGSAPPGTMPPGNYQSPQSAPTVNSYGTSTVGVSPGYRG